jgi:hypothetical protein
MRLFGRYKCLTHQSFLKKLTGETAIKSPTKEARCFKFSLRENGLPEAQMMPAMVRLNSVKAALRLGRFSGRYACECRRSVRAGEWQQRVESFQSIGL